MRLARLVAEPLRSETRDEFAHAVVEGFSKAQKSLPSRFLYDAEGSLLFEKITDLPDYYPTRIETAILEAHASEMVDGIYDDGVLVEFGSGSSTKTEILLRHLSVGVAYVPIDISQTALAHAEQRLLSKFPHLYIYPILADFSGPLSFPPEIAARPMLGFFPGSTIGNLVPHDASELLGVVRKRLAANGRLIIGVDLKKDARKLVLAYDDAAGVTAAFNRNLLARINRELDGCIDPSSFYHEAIYDPREGRIEMHLVSTVDQKIKLCGEIFFFKAGERIHTENSYKYTISEFQTLAARAGFRPSRVWTDDQQNFSVHELIPSI